MSYRLCDTGERQHFREAVAPWARVRRSIPQRTAAPRWPKPSAMRRYAGSRPRVSTKSRAARQGRNPRTGESIAIAPSKAPSFKAGKTLRDAVHG